MHHHCRLTDLLTCTEILGWKGINSILVDERGAPLSVVVTGANRHEKWSVQELISGIIEAVSV